jgi:hypothetical protein
MTEHLAAEVAELRVLCERIAGENERLREEVAELRAQRHQRGPTGEPAGTAAAAVERRRLLRLAGLAAVGGAAAALTPARPAAASTHPLVLGSVSNGAAAPTGLAVSGTNRTYGLGVTDNGANSLFGRPALFGHARGQAFSDGVHGLALQAAGIGVRGHAQGNNGTGVYGASSGTTGRGVAGFGGVGVWGSGSRFGVEGDTEYGTAGVVGRADALPAGGGTGAPYGVLGEAVTVNGTGVEGRATAATGSTRGVTGVSASRAGTGVLGRATATEGETYGVFGAVTSPQGYGVYSDGRAKVAGLLEVTRQVRAQRVVARAKGAVALDGRSEEGRGAVLAGKVAHLRLLPRAGRPARGEVGDIFVDRAARLWFCKGGTNWRQLA